MRRQRNAFIGMALLVLAACGRGQVPIPPEATEVHVTVADADVHLEPSSVRAGDTYLVLDEPLDGSFTLISGAGDASGARSSLTRAQLDGVASGDLQGTASESFDVGCSVEQRAQDRGQMGYCGNVWKVTLEPGIYAVIAKEPQPGQASSLAVLQVVTR